MNAPALTGRELKLPCHFDVKPFGSISLQSLRDHIERVGLPVYP